MNRKYCSPANSMSVRISRSACAISAFDFPSGMTGAVSPRAYSHPMPRRPRLSPAIFQLPVEKMRQGYYSDVYFNRAKEILIADQRRPRVRMQVFQRNTAYLCGIDEALAILRLCSGRQEGGGWKDGWDRLSVRALHD